MKKLVCMLLAIVMLSGLGFSAVAVDDLPESRSAADVAATLAAIAEFNQTHGGQGELSASVRLFLGTDIPYIIITGQVMQATRGLRLGVNEVHLEAKLSGETKDGEALVEGSTICVKDGAEIKTNGIAIDSSGILAIQGGVVEGTLHFHDLYLSGGVVNAPSLIPRVAGQGEIGIGYSAQVSVDCVDALEHSIIRDWSLGAADGITGRLTNWIRGDSTGLTVIGHVTRYSVVLNSYTGSGEQLLIPSGTSLTVTGYISPGDEAIIINGELFMTYPENIFGSGHITGANAGDFARGTPRPTKIHDHLNPYPTVYLPVEESTGFGFPIYSSVYWVVTTNVDWLTPSVYSGQGNGGITFFVPTNTGRTRTGTITVTADCGEVITVTVVQHGLQTPWWEAYPAWFQFILRWLFFGWLWME